MWLPSCLGKTDNEKAEKAANLVTGSITDLTTNDIKTP